MSTAPQGIASVSSLRTTEVSQDKGNLTAAKTAGELAGRFATLLQELSGEETPTGASLHNAPPAQAMEGRVALSAVSLLALDSSADETATPQAAPSQGNEPIVDVRWAAKLFNDTPQAAE